MIEKELCKEMQLIWIWTKDNEGLMVIQKLSRD